MWPTFQSLIWTARQLSTAPDITSPSELLVSSSSGVGSSSDINVVARLTCLLKIHGFGGFTARHRFPACRRAAACNQPASLESGQAVKRRYERRSRFTGLTSSEHPSSHIWFSSCLIPDPKFLKLKEQLQCFQMVPKVALSHLSRHQAVKSG